MTRLPRWADLVLVPLISLALAFGLSALVILAIGQDPWEALRTMVTGALGSSYGWGYTLYYATNFIFTGLAVAVAAHAGLFNIGAEGQASLGGLGVALVALALPWPHWGVALPVAMVGAALFGAMWAFIPAILQAKRGSHIVITTIMFNFLAAALLNWLLVNVLRPPGSMDPASARFPESTQLPRLTDMAAAVGIEWGKSTPANISFLIALAACVLVWLLIWRSRLGFEIRAFGKSEPAALYAGINPVRITVIAMLISGGLAGLAGAIEVMGVTGYVTTSLSPGYGYFGIVVAMLANLNPLGVVAAALFSATMFVGADAMGRTLGVPSYIADVTVALSLLAMLVALFFTQYRVRR